MLLSLLHAKLNWVCEQRNLKSTFYIYAHNNGSACLVPHKICQKLVVQHTIRCIDWSLSSLWALQKETLPDLNSPTWEQKNKASIRPFENWCIATRSRVKLLLVMHFLNTLTKTCNERSRWELKIFTSKMCLNDESTILPVKCGVRSRHTQLSQSKAPLLVALMMDFQDYPESFLPSLMYSIFFQKYSVPL